MERAVRPATEADLAAVNDIYNHYVRSSPATFDLEERTQDQRREWLAEHGGGRHRAFVSDAGGRIEGFATSSPWRPKAAYARTVETSVYVAPDATGRGVGSALYRALFDALDGEDVHRAVAGMTLPNDASRALHLAVGFRPVGVFTEQGFKFGRYWDVEWFERPLGYSEGPSQR
jgi:phosphinothricin acetyltransferase